VLSDFYQFITDGGEMLDHLFDFNVRDYQGDVEVNKGIRDALTGQPTVEDFTTGSFQQGVSYCIRFGILSLCVVI
jgi:hypothetical protein